MKRKEMLVTIFFAAGVCLLIVAAAQGVRSPPSLVVLEGAPFAVSPEAQSVKLSYPGLRGSLPRVLWLPIERTPDREPKAFVRLPELANAEVSRLDGSGQRVSTVPVGYALLAALGALLLLMTLPRILFVLAQKAGSDGGQTPWYFLLAEEGGGYSLSRFQLLVWFAAAVVCYAGLSVPVCGFEPLSTAFAVLLGMSGATSILGAATSPTPSALAGTSAGSAPAVASTAAAPSGAPPGSGTPPPFPTGSTSSPAVASDVRDLVTDWRGNGDLTRYQYLLLSLIGAILLAASAARELRLPAIPERFLYIVAISQGTYLTTKAVKGTNG